MAEQLTTGPMALKCGIQEHHLRKLCAAGKVPHKRTGRYLAFDPRDADRVRRAARVAGYLPADPAAGSACPVG